MFTHNCHCHKIKFARKYVSSQHYGLHDCDLVDVCRSADCFPFTVDKYGILQ